MSEFCDDCKFAVPACGYGEADCNSDVRPDGVGIINAALASIVVQESLVAELLNHDKN